MWNTNSHDKKLAAQIYGPIKQQLIKKVAERNNHYLFRSEEAAPSL